MITYSNFSDLAHFYDRLDSVLPALQGENPCGSCLECCRYLFYLSKYEFDFLNHSLAQKNSPFSLAFVTLLPDARDPRFSQQGSICPLWEENTGCHAYMARPLACRLMGAYVPYNSDLIPHCVYRHPVVYHHVNEIPLWDDFVKILRKYPSPPGYFIRAEKA